MARGMTPTPSNPFGLTNSMMLEQMRSLEQNKILNQARANQSGKNFGATAAGLAIGNAMRGLFVKHGLMSDTEADTASAVTSAQNKARIVTESTPEELRPTNLYDQQAEYGLNLIGELTRAGLHDQADLVRQKLLADDKQRLELDKLKGEVAGVTERNIGQRISNTVSAATAEADIQKKVSDAISSSVSANVALGTEAFAVPAKRLELENQIETLRHNRANNPWVERRAQDDATISTIQARLGGPVPELVKLQTQRDNILAEMAKHPEQDQTYAKRTLEEINQKIQTTSLGIQRNVDNWSPTTQVKSDLQNNLVQSQGFVSQAQSILDHMAKAPADSFGIDADTRVAVAGLGNKVLNFAGMPQSLANGFSSFVVSEDTLNARAQARQLKADIMSYLSSGSHATQTDRQTVDDMLQILDSPSVDRPQATIALTNFISWVGQQQEARIKVLDSNVRALAPAASTSIEDQLSSWANGPGAGK